MEPIRVPRTRIGMTFKDHAQIQFDAQRAEARGEFRDMLPKDSDEVCQSLGKTALEIAPDEGVED